jgi:hypothetical protein
VFEKFAFVGSGDDDEASAGHGEAVSAAAETIGEADGGSSAAAGGSAEGGTIASQAPPADEELSPVERVVLVLEGGEPQEDEGTSADTE